MNGFHVNLFMGVCIVALASCQGNSADTPSTTVSDAKYIGQAVGNFSADEWYPGGLLGTTLNVTAGCYEDETPATTEQGLTTAFNHGEQLFERTYTLTTKPFWGLGPASVRKSCLHCHPAYGHGKRQDEYRASTVGNGYLLVIYTPADGANSDDGPYIDNVTGMPQTQAVSPFLPPIDESKIPPIAWNTVSSMESGLPMKFKDGEQYSLIYPVVTIPQEAFNVDPVPSGYAVRLESTLGVIGTGLLDAIPTDSIRVQYQREAPYVELNPSFWDKDKNDFAAGAWYTLAQGYLADGTPYGGTAEGKTELKRFTYAMTRASLQDGPGANAIWNITNVSRSDRPKLYTTKAWAKKMSQTREVIDAIKADPSSPYYADGTEEGIADAVLNLLDPSTNQFDNDWHNFDPEMTDSDYYDFLVWQRGLAIPRARNLNDATVQKGKELFNQIGCANCHRAQWHTTTDNYWSPQILDGKPLPRYADQTIYPYTDMIHHRLYMKEGIHGSWCRTTPLWGRGLHKVNTGSADRLHDCRARNTLEAIMWHGYSAKSDAFSSTEKFYNLSKEERDAVIKFVDSI